jgi:hypothetical protein
VLAGQEQCGAILQTKITLPLQLQHKHYTIFYPTLAALVEAMDRQAAL